MTCRFVEIGRAHVDYAFARSDDETVASAAPEHWRRLAAGKRFARDAMLELAAGGLLALMLRELGRRFDPQALRVAGNGKPFLPGGPHFNLSHSGKFAMCAVSTSPVGCDIEEIVPLEDEVLRQIGSIGEWTLAEARYKCGAGAAEAVRVEAPAGYAASIAADAAADPAMERGGVMV